MPISKTKVHPVIRLRITVVPQWWPARRGYVRGLGVDPDVIENLPDLCALGDERNQPHLPATDGEQQREHFVNTGDDHGPKVMGWALG